MPDVISTAPADVRLWVSLDVHKLSIVAATLLLVSGPRTWAQQVPHVLVVGPVQAGIGIP